MENLIFDRFIIGKLANDDNTHFGDYLVVAKSKNSDSDLIDRAMSKAKLGISKKDLENEEYDFGFFPISDEYFVACRYHASSLKEVITHRYPIFIEYILISTEQLFQIDWDILKFFSLFSEPELYTKINNDISTYSMTYSPAEINPYFQNILIDLNNSIFTLLNLINSKKNIGIIGGPEKVKNKLIFLSSILICLPLKIRKNFSFATQSQAANSNVNISLSFPITFSTEMNIINWGKPSKKFENGNLYVNWIIDQIYKNPSMKEFHKIQSSLRFPKNTNKLAEELDIAVEFYEKTHSNKGYNWMWSEDPIYYSKFSPLLSIDDLYIYITETLRKIINNQEIEEFHLFVEKLYEQISNDGYIPHFTDLLCDFLDKNYVDLLNDFFSKIKLTKIEINIFSKIAKYLFLEENSIHARNKITLIYIFRSINMNWDQDKVLNTFEQITLNKIYIPIEYLFQVYDLIPNNQILEKLYHCTKYCSEKERKDFSNTLDILKFIYKKSNASPQTTIIKIKKLNNELTEKKLLIEIIKLFWKKVENKLSSDDIDTLKKILHNLSIKAINERSISTLQDELKEKYSRVLLSENIKILPRNIINTSNSKEHYIQKITEYIDEIILKNDYQNFTLLSSEVNSEEFLKTIYKQSLISYFKKYKPYWAKIIQELKNRNLNFEKNILLFRYFFENENEQFLNNYYADFGYAVDSLPLSNDPYSLNIEDIGKLITKDQITRAEKIIRYWANILSNQNKILAKSVYKKTGDFIDRYGKKFPNLEFHLKKKGKLTSDQRGWFIILKINKYLKKSI